jgi:predicted metalloprotease with PDZ domain
MIYEVSAPQPNNRFLHITTRVTFSSDEVRILQLPVWRPGRYERGDFAQYVRNLRITDLSDNPLPFKKLGLSAWKVETDEPEIIVRYEFWAGLLNAGSTFVSEHMIYINPVNCLMYKPGREHELCELIIHMPAHFKTAGSLKEIAPGRFKAVDYHSLADSPIIASDRLSKTELTVNGISFRFWFCAPEIQAWNKILPDVEAIIRTQLKTMYTFPTERYEVLTHLLPYHAYHGVEHLQSTVITLGPASDFFEPSVYPEFLGVFSHELFHVWNVKSIRPADMLPYDYSRENFSPLGYVYEGITTYYGDLFCLRAGVFSWNFFCSLLNDWLTRHVHNFGRMHFSLAESSLETWLDGYKPGVPDRKVNIYNEGALCALMADWFIRIKSNHRHSLDDVMRSMNGEFGDNKKGYARDDYRRHLERWAGESVDFLFNDYLEGRKDYLALISDLAPSFGLTIQHNPNPLITASIFGLKTRTEQNRILVDKIVPGSPAELGGLSINDELVSAHDFSDLIRHPQWDISIPANEALILQVISMGESRQRILQPGENRFLPLFSLEKSSGASDAAKQAFSKWAGCPF